VCSVAYSIAAQDSSRQQTAA
jgi:2-methylaconitate cis-trans-isomerase PrpF